MGRRFAAAGVLALLCTGFGGVAVGASSGPQTFSDALRAAGWGVEGRLAAVLSRANAVCIQKYVEGPY